MVSFSRIQLSIASLWGQRSTDFLLAHLVEASLGPPRRTRSVARGGFRRLGFYVTNLPGLRARHVCPCLGAGMPARPLTPERPRPHTPRFAPPGRPGGLLRRQRAWGRARCQGPVGGFAGGLVRSARPGIAFHPQTQSRPAPARSQSQGFDIRFRAQRVSGRLRVVLRWRPLEEEERHGARISFPR